MGEKAQYFGAMGLRLPKAEKVLKRVYCKLSAIILLIRIMRDT